jgi:hypothetical protein
LTAVRRIVVPAAWKTASKDAVKFDPRSRITSWLACRVLLKIAYLLTSRVPGVAVLVFRGGRSKAAELLVHWRENAVRPCRAAPVTGQAGSRSRPPVSALA